MNGEPFDQDVTLPNLQGLSYTSDPIGMSDGSLNLVTGTALGDLTLAIRTGLGRCAKLRLSSVITRDSDTDLVLEVFVYRQSNWDWTAKRAEPGVKDVMALCIDNVNSWRIHVGGFGDAEERRQTLIGRDYWIRQPSSVSKTYRSCLPMNE